MANIQDAIKDTTSKAIVLAKKKSAEAQKIALATKVKTVAVLKNPNFQTVTVGSGAGAVVLGGVGGAFGTACGVVVGTTAGALPALFTFGLSLPIGAVFGGAVGGSAGIAAGGSAGALVGGAAGHGAFRYRIEIKDGLIYVRKQAISKVEKATLTIKDTANGIKTRVSTASSAATSFALAKASAAKSMAVEKAKKVSTAAVAATRDPCLQVTAASAVGGAAVLAPAGGVTGGVAGGFVGGVVGLPAAFFTFGLSIPVCAAIGGGMGLCAGAVAGGSAGAVGGGSIGYGSYAYRKEIKNTATSAQKKIGAASLATKKKIDETTDIVRAKASAIVSGGTGSSVHSID